MRYFELLRHRKVVRNFGLDKSSILIGRDTDCDIVIDSGSVSRRHARVDFGAGTCTIVDLGSTNGVVTAGGKVNSRELSPGESVRLGSYELRYRGDSSDLSIRSAALLNSRDPGSVSPRLEMFLDEQAQGRVLIGSSRILIGKSPQAEIKLTGFLDPVLHSAITTAEDGCVNMEILAPSPEVLVSGVPYKPGTRAVLQDRDWITIGRLKLVVRLPTELTLLHAALPVK